jgi:hypothetical protein
VAISLGGLLPDRSSSLPGSAIPEGIGRRAASLLHSSNGPCLALLLTGVAWPAHYCARRWSLTPPFHPYFHPFPLSLWERVGERVDQRYVSVARSGRLLRPGNYPTPCPVERGLSSTAKCKRGHPTSLGSYMIPAMQLPVNQMDLGYNQANRGLWSKIINPGSD